MGLSNPSSVGQAVRVFSQTAAGTISIPPNAALVAVYARNNTANAVTGGIKFGTTLGGTDIIAALAVGANALVAGTPLISDLSATAGTIYFDAVAAWNSASVDICVVYNQAF